MDMGEQNQIVSCAHKILTGTHQLSCAHKILFRVLELLSSAHEKLLGTHQLVSHLHQILNTAFTF